MKCNAPCPSIHPFGPCVKDMEHNHHESAPLNGVPMGWPVADSAFNDLYFLRKAARTLCSAVEAFTTDPWLRGAARTVRELLP